MNNPFQLTEAKLKQMILEVMYSPRTLVKSALADPDVDPKIKNLLSSQNEKDKMQGLSLLQYMYPEKYETNLKYSDPERAELGAKARKGVEGDTADTSIDWETRPNQGRIRNASGELERDIFGRDVGSHFGASRIDDPTYEKEFELQNDPLTRMENRIKSEYLEFEKVDSSGLAQDSGPLEVSYDQSKKSSYYNKLVVHSRGDSDGANGPLVSYFHEFLNKRGYSTSEIQNPGGNHFYMFEVYLD